MNFEWNLFNFIVRDCLLLVQCVVVIKGLKVFRFYRSKVDDDKVRVLISYILDYLGLMELDLFYNVISDRGVRVIGKFFNNYSQLVKLNFCDNDVRYSGV